MTIETTRLTLGPKFSEGARLLWRVIANHSWSQGELARACGAKAGVVPRWLYGDTKPSWVWAAKLRDLFDIPLEAWTLEPTTGFIPPAARERESGIEVGDLDEGAA